MDSILSSVTTESSPLKPDADADPDSDSEDATTDHPLTDPTSSSTMPLLLRDKLLSAIAAMGDGLVERGTEVSDRTIGIIMGGSLMGVQVVQVLKKS